MSDLVTNTEEGLRLSDGSTVVVRVRAEVGDNNGFCRTHFDFLGETHTSIFLHHGGIDPRGVNALRYRHDTKFLRDLGVEIDPDRIADYVRPTPGHNLSVKNIQIESAVATAIWWEGQ